ncbi:carboxypeptidase regulatory-like domain-containing protein [Thermus amyloliquefaciens]|uniref:carboxypeptidase regulatory-like domain-containing protein n=1 Tax=Thermus amyloliquefaciens TaxID=1449080 RepID=UPI00056FFE4B|nr:carboxypeptidase regulatory-like domain-containing protein [Thermus amyloliquefaciens]
MKGNRLKAFGFSLLGALALFLASCGQQPPPSPQTGNLSVTVLDASNNNPIPGAVVGVSGPQTTSGLTDSQGKVTFSNLPVGSYTVVASSSGYQQASSTANVQANQTAQVTLRLTPSSGGGGGGGDSDGTSKVARLEIVSVADASGSLPSQRERNTNKVVNLYAAQTEEAIRVTVRALDAQGRPVPGALVEAGVDTGALQGVNIFSGCGFSAQSSRPVGVTGANGEVCFTLFATSLFAQLLDQLEVLYNFQNPVKLVVSSNGQLDEAKFFFYNVSHLIYSGEGQDIRRSSARAGSNLGQIANNYSFDRPRLNDHIFNSLLRRKQPDSAPFTPQSRGIGYMVYTINDASMVSWVPTNLQLGVNSCEQITNNGTTCVDLDGSGVTLRPKSPQEGITPEDLPIQVNVTATWVALASYGEEEYSFPLKSYTFTKVWGGTGVQITKSGPRVIGWSGVNLSPTDVTLPKSGASVPAGAVYEYTITVRNTGNVPAQNAVITDKLPAELGFAAASDGATYDPVLHQVTWHWTTTPALQSIPVGGSVTVKVKLYARHKPGYAWNDNRGGNDRPDGLSDSYDRNDQTGGFGNRPPIYPANTLYPDPYRITNIVEVVSEAPQGPGNFERQDTSLDIWVVRPFLSLNKVAVSPVYAVGDTARFVVTARNVDRALSDPDYNNLKAQFPEDYRNALTAYGVQVRDLFGRFLDFVNSSSNSGPGQLDANAKTLTFRVGDMALGSTWQAILDFRVSGGLNQGEGNPEWLTNCARLYALNLNQYRYGWGPVKNGQLEPVEGQDPRPEPPYQRERGNPDGTGNYLEACDRVQDANLTITNMGEFAGPETPPLEVLVWGDGGVSPFFQVDTIVQPVRVGDTFYYIYLLTNQGSVPLNDIDFLVYRTSGSSVELDAQGGFAVYRGTGADWYSQDSNFVLTASAPTQVRIQSTVAFAPLQPGESLVIVVRAKAIAQGRSTFEAYAQTTNPLNVVTLYVQDTTNVQNPQ